jgi:hypothetical protein
LYNKLDGGVKINTNWSQYVMRYLYTKRIGQDGKTVTQNTIEQHKKTPQTFGSIGSEVDIQVATEDGKSKTSIDTVPYQKDIFLGAGGYYKLWTSKNCCDATSTKGLDGPATPTTLIEDPTGAGPKAGITPEAATRPGGDGGTFTDPTGNAVASDFVCPDLFDKPMVIAWLSCTASLLFWKFSNWLINFTTDLMFKSIGFNSC